MSKVAVVGGGPAGMMAAIWAAKNNHQVHLFEKNEKLGKKLFITGKGRCNLTNACEIEELFNGILTNHSFLYSSFNKFSNKDVMSFFEECGVPLKVERGSRVFPGSDLSSDIIRTLEKKLRELQVNIHFNTRVKEILVERTQLSEGNRISGEVTVNPGNSKVKEGTTIQIKGLRCSHNRIMDVDSCIIATGGLSYPETGSTGDGYGFAKKMGHEVTKLYPSLVPIEVQEEDVKGLQGLTLRNVNVKVFPLIEEEGLVYDKKRLLYEEFGEMTFTDFGVSGPIILSASGVIGKELEEENLALILDLKPALSFQQLDKRMLREISENPKRQFRNGIKTLFPVAMVPVMIKRSGIDSERQMSNLTKEERHHFVHVIKNFAMTLTDLRPIKEGIITKGGINVKEINPGTMESKLVKNVYYVGEVLDIDGVTGGFNLQIAWSTGALAGSNIE